MRQERLESENRSNEKISEHMMQYEELRSLTVIHFEKICEQNFIIAEITEKLAEMTRKKEFLDDKLVEREKDFDLLTGQFEKKCMEFIDERKAHKL